MLWSRNGALHDSVHTSGGHDESHASTNTGRDSRVGGGHHRRRSAVSANAAAAAAVSAAAAAVSIPCAESAVSANAAFVLWSAAAITPDQLDNLVSRIALYPD